MEQQNKEKQKLKMNRMQWTIAAGVLIGLLCSGLCIGEEQ